MNIPDPETLRRTYLEQVRSHVPEPILAIGFLSPGNIMRKAVTTSATSHLIFKASPLAALLFNRRKKATRTTRLAESPSQLVAVGPTSAYLFPFPAGQEFAVTAPPAVWVRSQTRVTAGEKGRFARKVHVEQASGEQLDFEIVEAKTWAGFSDAMLALLLDPVAA